MALFPRSAAHCPRRPVEIPLSGVRRVSFGLIATLVLLASAIGIATDAVAQNFAIDCDTGCHAVAGANGGRRVNAAGSVSVAQVANVFWGMGFAAGFNYTQHVADITNSPPPTPANGGGVTYTNWNAATRAVAYGGSGNVGIPNVLLTGVLDSMTASPAANTSFSGTTMTYSHPGGSGGNCNTQVITVRGTGPAADIDPGPGVTNVTPQTSPRTITITVNPPTLPALTLPSQGLPYNTAPTPLAGLGLNGVANGVGNIVQPAVGTVSFVGGNVRYAASASAWSGTVNFSVNATGPCGTTSATATNVTLTIGLPPPPVTVAPPATVNVGYQAATPINLTAQISGIVDANPVVVATGPANGSTLVAGNVVTYTPNLAYVGPDSFTYTKSGPGGTSIAGTVTINVVNAPPPTVANRAVNVAFNTPLPIDLTAQVAGFINNLSVVTPPTSGAVGAFTGNVVTYTPNSGYIGGDSFTYTATGPGGPAAAPATVTISVIAPPPPTAANRAVTVSFDTPTPIDLTPQLTGFVSNLAVLTGPANGTTSIAGNVITYTPNPFYVGADTFTYRANGPGGPSAPATVTITVSPAVPPTAATISVTVPYNTATPIDLTPQILGLATAMGIVTGPAHGTATASGKVVTYTPTAGYIGNDSFTYQASGPGGFSPVATVYIVVAPPSPPTAANRSVTITYNAPAAINLTAQVTGASTGISVVTPPEHGTATVNGYIVTYTPASGYTGPDSFGYVATGPGGTSAIATVSITVSSQAASAGPATITVQLNTPTTVDMTPYITGSALSGIAVAALPMHGTVTVNGTSLTFTPTRDFFGADAFTYKVFGNVGASAPGVVNIVVVGRPDPSQDAAVTGLIAAQADAAQRFSRTQISNTQRRMESLHRRTDNSAPPDKGAENPRPAAKAPDATNVSEASRKPDRATDEPGQKAGSLAGQVMSLLSGRSIDFASVSALGSSGETGAGGASAPGFWLFGVGNFGTRDANAKQGSLEFSTSGISAGVDRRFGEDWVFGLGVGYGRDKTDIGTDGTQSKAQGYAVSAYGSWQPGPKTYIDALLGYGTLDFDTRRFVAPMGEYATGSRDGSQFFASVAAGYEQRNDATLVSPYARLDYASSKLNSSTESGAGRYALTYSSQTTPFFQGALGIRAESVHATEFGWAAPRLRAEFQHVFKGDHNASISYADLLGGPQYVVTTGASNGNAIVLGVGSDFVRRDGWSIGFDYQLLRSSTDYMSHTVRVAVSKELDGRGWPFTTDSWLSSSKPIDLQVDAGYLYDDNVNRTNVSSERLSDSIYSVTANKTNTYSLGDLGENIRGLLNISAGVLGFKTYQGLDQAFVGVQGDLQYRTSGDFDAPTFAVFGRAFADGYRSDLRDGQRYSIGASVRQALTDRIGIFGALAYNIRNARSEVWDNRESAARLSLDYALTPRSTVYLVGEYRRGNIVSTTNNPSLEQLDIANVFVRDNAFPGRYFSYQFDGRTVVSTLGYNIGFGPRDSLDFTWIRAQSTADSRPSFGSTPSDYVVNQYSIIYLMRF